jgi:hypothetical protein
MPDPTPSCSACSELIPDPAERWPDNATGTVCQECWEAQCSREWWELVRLVSDYAKQWESHAADHRRARARA